MMRFPETFEPKWTNWCILLFWRPRHVRIRKITADEIALVHVLSNFTGSSRSAAHACSVFQCDWLIQGRHNKSPNGSGEFFARTHCVENNRGRLGAKNRLNRERGFPDLGMNCQCRGNILKKNRILKCVWSVVKDVLFELWITTFIKWHLTFFPIITFSKYFKRRLP